MEASHLSTAYVNLFSKPIAFNRLCFFLAMKAVDADLHSSLTYRIRAKGSDPGVLQLFHVDPASGDLSMLKVLDFEELDDPEPTYTFTVEAVDQEGIMPPGLTSVTVTIRVGVPKHDDWD